MVNQQHRHDAYLLPLPGYLQQLLLYDLYVLCMRIVKQQVEGCHAIDLIKYFSNRHEKNGRSKFPHVCVKNQYTESHPFEAKR